jgi:hypothetical protein
MQPCLVIGISSTVCDMQYHDKDDTQTAHGTLGIRLAVIHPIELARKKESWTSAMSFRL